HREPSRPSASGSNVAADPVVAPDELRYSWWGGVSTVPLRHNRNSDLAGPLAGYVRPVNAGRGRSGRARCLLTASMLGNLQTIGPLGLAG
ncbi:MAG: hypothetical protein ACXVH1_37910, partial [Solirubrobacteraceae bacterium]